jgi:hypothetical protein
MKFHRRSVLFSPVVSKSALRLMGLILVPVFILLPALPLGPLAAHPWTPLAALWAAYGWAADRAHNWRAPALLFGFGLLHDLVSGGPLGLFAMLYLGAYLIGWVAALAMRSPNILSLWGSFIATCAGIVFFASVLSPWATQGQPGLWPFINACAVTALLFPLIRPLYMDVETV